MHNLFIHNLKFKHFLNEVVINLKSSRNFANMKGVRRKCNLLVSFLKFKFNKKNIEWFNITLNNVI